MIISAECFCWNCLLTARSYYCIYLFACCCFVFTGIYFHAAVQFDFSTVTVLSAESLGGSTPGIRVMWNTTVPPECVASVRVEFRTKNNGPVVATNTTTNISQTEIIQTGLRCGTYYYIRVLVISKLRSSGGMPQMLSPKHSDVHVLVGGKETVCM